MHWAGRPFFFFLRLGWGGWGAILARLCLAQLLLKRRQADEALDMCKTVLAMDANNADAWSLLATMHTSRGDLRSARKTFEHVLLGVEASEATVAGAAGTVGGKRDVLALVALGNLHHRLAKQQTARAAVRVGCGEGGGTCAGDIRCVRR